MSTEVIAVPSLSALPPVAAMQGSALVYGGVKAIHLFGVALLVGTVFAFDLRVFGVASHLGAKDLAKFLLPISLLSLVLIFPSGVALFAANHAELLTSSLFAAKMGLLLVNATLAVVFMSGPMKAADDWRHGAPVTARLIAGISILSWGAVLVLASAMPGGEF
ncbi:MAG: hypothetical protein ACPGQI_02585 [Gammaproteobacteria bacterium]